MDYYVFKQAAMVKLVDTLLFGSSARASRFESEWRHSIFGIVKDFQKFFVVITLHLMTLLVNEIVIRKRHGSYFFLYNRIISYSLEKNSLSAITAPSAIFTQVFSTSGLLTQMHQSAILVPALQSRWLMMHVSMMVLGYAALLCGSLLSVTLLIILFQKDIIRIFDKQKHLLNESFFFSEIQYMNEKSNINIVQNASPSFVGNYYKSQLIEQLNHWSYRVISLGFIFLTIGILSEAVWANEAWGSYWNRDPKETGDLLLGPYLPFIYIFEQIKTYGVQI
ncbi:Cytochrome c biogenesis protein CcsA, partial [Bienertia sinuspersici]